MNFDPVKYVNETFARVGYTCENFVAKWTLIHFHFLRKCTLLHFSINDRIVNQKWIKIHIIHPSRKNPYPEKSKTKKYMPICNAFLEVFPGWSARWWYRVMFIQDLHTSVECIIIGIWYLKLKTYICWFRYFCPFCNQLLTLVTCDWSTELFFHKYHHRFFILPLIVTDN